MSVLLQGASLLAVIYTKSRDLRKTGKTPIWLELDGETPAIWMARSQVAQHVPTKIIPQVSLLLRQDWHLVMTR
jgi:hypothetical protein